jgi:hypothetical protein
VADRTEPHSSIERVAGTAIITITSTTKTDERGDYERRRDLADPRRVTLKRGGDGTDENGG